MTRPTLMAQLVELQEENARLREDAERWRLVVSHWTSADIRYNEDGSFKNLSIHAAANQISDEANIEKLNRAVDSARKEQK